MGEPKVAKSMMLLVQIWKLLLVKRWESLVVLKVNDNLSVSPIVQIITDPGNTQSNTVLTGTLRTVFSF